jgi:HD-GYP domain-containing protein (c-di-GMP phosphodiesterase class II)
VARTEVRLSELLAVLSLGADLGMSQPLEHVLRATVLALRIADEVPVDERERAVVYYSSLVAWVGCHVDAYEQAKWWGDDLALKRLPREFDMAGFTATRRMLGEVGAGHHGLDRARIGVGFVATGRHDADAMLANHAHASSSLCTQLALDDAVTSSVVQTFERWDGKGYPEQLRGDAIARAARIVNLADALEVFHRASGTDAAVAVARERRGTQFDPALVDLVVEHAATLFDGLDAETTWDAVVAAAPAPDEPLDDAGLDDALGAIADFADVKSPWTIGHSRAVAELAGDAAEAHGLPMDDRKLVWRAGLVHDLGRLGVSNAIWDKPGPLSGSERERVHLHPYLSGRMLASCRGLAPLRDVAVAHHERLDGSGYPNGLKADALSPATRLLAVADAYRGRVEPRPYRAAGEPDAVAQSLRADARDGRFDAGAVEAVLRAAGHRTRKRGDWPAGLTNKEVEVLRLLARGLSNKEIAEELVISRKTVGHHIDHIYTKVGVSNRARASLFAAQHGLAT